jgi:hypothetical protein
MKIVAEYVDRFFCCEKPFQEAERPCDVYAAGISPTLSVKNRSFDVSGRCSMLQMCPLLVSPISGAESGHRPHSTPSAVHSFLRRALFGCTPKAVVQDGHLTHSHASRILMRHDPLVLRIWEPWSQTAVVQSAGHDHLAS